MENRTNEELNVNDFFEIFNDLKNRFLTFLYQKLNSIIAHKLPIIILLFLGFLIGYSVDYFNTFNGYKHQIQVQPNFDSTNYLYKKVNLINEKIKENEFSFFEKNIGLNKVQFTNIESIKITPSADIFDFMSLGKSSLNNTTDNPNPKGNLDLFNLINNNKTIIESKVIENELVREKYKFQIITIITKSKFDFKGIDLVLEYINNDNYYNLLKKQYLFNLKNEIKENEILIKQINNFLNTLSSNGQDYSMSSKEVVLLNQTTNMTDILGKKEALLLKQNENRIDLLNFNDIIKEKYRVINVKYIEYPSWRIKYILPLLSFILYILTIKYKNFEKKES